MNLKIEKFVFDDSYFLELEKKSSSSLDHIIYLAQKKHNADLRSGTACCKTRSEVRCTNAKPFKQKGSGRARRGTNRTPLRRGGGVIFGPKPRSYNSKLNKKVLSLARKSLLHAFKENIFLLTETEKVSKTKQIHDVLSKNFTNNQNLILVLSSQDDILWRNSVNLPIRFSFIEELDFSAFLNSDIVILTESSSKELI